MIQVPQFTLTYRLDRDQAGVRAHGALPQLLHDETDGFDSRDAAIHHLASLGGVAWAVITEDNPPLPRMMCAMRQATSAKRPASQATGFPRLNSARFTQMCRSGLSVAAVSRRLAWGLGIDLKAATGAAAIALRGSEALLMADTRAAGVEALKDPKVARSARRYVELARRARA